MDPLFYTALILVAIFFAYRAMVAKRILTATGAWAGVSASCRPCFILLGAHEVAVIELSVQAGLVTVLLVYALSVVGEDAIDPSSVVSKPLAYVFAAGVGVALIWLLFPMSGKGSFLRGFQISHRALGTACAGCLDPDRPEFFRCDGDYWFAV